MSQYNILKAVEFDKLPVKFKKQFPGGHDELLHKGWWLQRKYDGCFGMAVVRADGTSQMLSRTGEDYTASCGHILAELRDAADVHYGPHWTEFIVLGEVWHKSWDFPTISGKFRKQQACPDLLFVANDLLPVGLVTDGKYSDRFESLLKLLPEEPGADVHTLVADTWDDSCVYPSATAAAQEFKDEGGYDGAILRDPNSGYTIGTVKAGEIVKVKPSVTLDLRITAWEERPGEKTGRPVCTIAVEYRGMISWVGSGVPHGYRPQIGQIVEIEAMGFTPDGFLREPRFKGDRIDKLQPDT